MGMNMPERASFAKWQEARDFVMARLVEMDLAR